MKRFIVNIIDKRMIEAVADAERILTPGSALYHAIIKKTDWAFNSGTGAEICMKLASPTKVCPIFTYRPKWPWSSAIAYYQKGAIHFNIYKLPDMSHSEIVATLCHEYSHHVGFGHGNNYKTKEKILHSVPYYISENISDWL
jgi:hypothetical protein